MENYRTRPEPAFYGLDTRCSWKAPLLMRRCLEVNWFDGLSCILIHPLSIEGTECDIGRWGMAGPGGSMSVCPCPRQVFLPAAPFPLSIHPGFQKWSSAPSPSPSAIMCCLTLDPDQWTQQSVDLWNCEHQMNFSLSKLFLASIVVTGTQAYQDTA